MTSYGCSTPSRASSSQAADPSQPDEVLDIAVQKAIAAVNTSVSGSLGAEHLSVPIAGQTVIATDSVTGDTYES